jgi:hypothetical protein
LDSTDKEKGTLTVRDTNFSRLDDSDLRNITFLVKRVDRDTTSVSIEPGSQKVYGGDELIKAIGTALSREIKA